MRTTFNEYIETCRDRANPLYKTETGDHNGAFLLRCPISNERLRILISDGSDWNDAGLGGEPWEHVSVSASTRCPTWDEMCWVKQQFFGDNEAVVQFHPAAKEYINFHPTCLHLWKMARTSFPIPPSICVGPKP